MRALILAGTAEQASALARMLQLDRSEWDYLHSVERMRGRRGTSLLLWGTWRDRPAEELEQILYRAKVWDMPVIGVRREQ